LRDRRGFGEAIRLRAKDKPPEVIVATRSLDGVSRKERERAAAVAAERGVYVDYLRRWVRSQTADGQELTTRSIREGENIEAITGALWEELDRVDPPLRLVHP
jgi:hypothetical protein